MRRITQSIFFIALILTSCNEEFITLEPIGQQLETNFYQNEEEMFQGLISVYDVLSWGGTSGWTMNLGLLTAASDESFAGGSDRSDQPSWVAWDEFTINPEIGPQDGFWRKYYTGIGRANVMLEKLAESEGLDPNVIGRITAEVRFLRAYYYFDLVRLFGNVIIISDRLGPQDVLDQVQAPRSDVYDFIEQDLLAAYNEPLIPENISNSDLGRVSRGAVTALLGKVLLFRDDENRFLEAAGYFDEVINSRNYDLESNFEDIFRFDNEWGQESIWEIQHSTSSRGGWESFSNGTEGNYTTQFIGMRDYVGPTSSQYDGPEFATGWSFCPVAPEFAEFMRSDPRFAHTIIDGNQIKNLGGSYTEGFQNTDFFLRKYAPIQDFRATDGEPAINWGNNERIIRLADVLLMSAEAHVRGGGDEALARGYVNQVRSRVALRPISNSGQALIDAIYRERRLELATEGHRFFDLVRTGEAANALEGFVVGKHELLPIPQREIDLTQGGLIQNPGY